MQRRSRVPLVILTIVALLSLGGGYTHLLVGSASGRPTSAHRPAVGPPQARVPAGAPTHGAPAALAPDFTANRLDGTPVKLSSYRGVQPVVLDFFATWCPNCRRNVPKLSALADRYSGRITIIGVNLQEDPGTVQQFASRYGVQFPIVMDPTGAIASAYGIAYTNVHVLINRDGRIVRTVVGDLSESELTEILSLLAV